MEKNVSHPAYQALVAELIKARKDAGLTTRQLAPLLGEDQPFVVKTETFVRKLSALEMVQYAKALNLDPADLVKLIESKLR